MQRRHAKRRASYGVCLAAVAGLLSTTVHAQDDFSFEVLDVQVADESSVKYEDGRRALREGRFEDAINLLAEVMASTKEGAVHPGAQYHLAKALYRAGLGQASLTVLAEILDIGPKHPYFVKARDWLFFIAHRIKDQQRALELISQYAKPSDIPEESRDELNYLLGKFHMLRALEQGAQGVKVEVEEEPEPEEEEGGFNFSLDDLGGGDGELEFSLDELYDDEPVKKKKKRRRKKKKKKARGRRRRGKPAKATPAPKPEPQTEALDLSGIDDERDHIQQNPADANASLKRALKHLGRVSPTSPYAPKAMYVKGLAYFTLGEFEPSVAAWREVVRATHPKTGAFPNPKLRELSFFSLARVHYQFEQFRYAIFYYERVDRDSPGWLDALFEASWAHFRLGRYERTLGNIVTIESPFFYGAYYPEIHILKAITFYENCRYPEARAFLGDFEKDYAPVIGQLSSLLAENETPKSLFDALREMESALESESGRDGSDGALKSRLVRLALSDKRVGQSRDAIAEVEAQLKALSELRAPAFAESETAETVRGALETRQVFLTRAAGRLARQKLQGELSFLNDLKSKLVRVQFEIAKQEKEAYEAEIRGESQTVPISDYAYTTATDDERAFWPFGGEYWRDELGTYEYTLTRGCRPPS